MASVLTQMRMSRSATLEENWRTLISYQLCSGLKSMEIVHHHIICLLVHMCTAVYVFPTCI